jgi:hypothetical protein
MAHFAQRAATPVACQGQPGSAWLAWQSSLVVYGRLFGAQLARLSELLHVLVCGLFGSNRNIGSNHCH